MTPLIALMRSVERLHILLDATRRDMVAFIKSRLQPAAAVRLIDGLLHRSGNSIGVHNHAAFDVAGGRP